MRWIALLAAFLALPSGALAFDQVGPAQAGFSSNTQVNSASNAATTIQIAAASNQRARLYSLSARCQGGAAPRSSVTITNGGTAIWSTGAASVSTTNYEKTWTVPLMGSPNSAMVVAIAACGADSVGILSIQADRY
jgi:hypothetical protein